MEQEGRVPAGQEGRVPAGLAAGVPAGQEGRVPAGLGGRLERLLARTVTRTRGVRHGLLGVAAVDGSWRWLGAHGDADGAGTPAATTTPYPIASVTKIVTAVVTMQLHERGALSIDDRLVDHLPASVTDGLHVLDGVDRTGEITLEHLLSHTSGLADYYEDEGPDGRSAQDRLLAGEDLPVPFDEVLRIVRTLRPAFAPQGSDLPKRKGSYSDTNYQLLGAVVEAVSGRPLHEVFASEVFDRLGLDDTAAYPHDPRSGPRTDAIASVWAKGGVRLQPDGMLRTQTPDGGIVSTLADQLRLLQGLVGGELFASPATFARMQQRFDRVFFPVDYGLGLMRYAPARWMSPAFRVPPLVGHTGSTATWLWWCPELEVCIAGTLDVASPPLPFRFGPRVLREIARAG